MFEIDLSEYNTRSMIIRDEQTDYDEKECLLSCYNVYEWKGYSFDTGKPTIYLKMCKYDDWVVNGSIKDSPHNNLPTEWMNNRGKEMRNRKLSPEAFHKGLMSMAASYQRNFSTKESPLR
eukprot:TRINITY_DN9400_c0_g1_i1.p1 TRINITY_DN9400_c0_g1~~TRINITY_DN9400_c0_g1_i1.p1  ORF type:complete len:120 (+),score=3.00 TRINITY_DN9400_c0_g1_i1:603-962(+)